MTGRLAGYGYWVVVATLATAIVGFGVFLLTNVGLAGLGPGTSVAPSARPPATAPAPSGMAAVPGMGTAVPANADCNACHLVDAGVIGLRPIPPVAHPIQGWSDCTACHSSATLVATAPGHSGIHAGACLTCHTQGNAPSPPPRPHRDGQNEECLDCHGKTAPLPSDMAHRTDRVCWLCHRLPDPQPPVPAHATVTGQTDCLTCHVAGNAGALPADHDGWTGTECLQCHGLPNQTAVTGDTAPSVGPGSAASAPVPGTGSDVGPTGAPDSTATPSPNERDAAGQPASPDAPDETSSSARYALRFP